MRLKLSLITRCFFFICVCYLVSFGGTKGKITGTITDKSTGDPLIGANIVIVGTGLGAATDVDGVFFIINIPSGNYQVEISYMGYQTVTVKNVDVIQDITTDLNLKMEPLTIEAEAVEVIAERPMIHKDVSATTQVISSSSLDNQVYESLNSLIQNTAGIAGYQGNTYIRGSRWTEVNYMIDGISLTNPITGGLMTNVNKDAIEEIVLQTGGFSAEYGNGMAGVVNVVTKDGGDRYSGSLRYKTDKPVSGYQLYKNANIWDFTFGGPVLKGMKFFLTGYLNNRDMNPGREVIAPDGTNLGRHPHEGSQEYRTNLKFTIPVTSKIKLRIMGSLNRSQQNNYSLFWRFGNDENQLDRLGAFWSKTKYGSMIIDHALSKKFYYTFKLGYLDWHTINGQRDRAEWSGNAIGANSNWWEDFDFRKPFLDKKYQLPGDPNFYQKWRLRDSQGVDDVYAARQGDAVSLNNPYGITGGIQNSIDADYFNNFIYAGDNDYYAENRDRRYTVKFDLTGQLNKNNEIKTGIEFNRHKVNRFTIGGMSTLNGVGITYPIIDFYEESPSDTALDVQDADHLGDGYEPIEFATYLNYQLNFKGIFFNSGLRFDYYNTNTEYRINPVQSTPANPFKQDRTTAEAKYQFSPRLGVAFPVSERIKFRFNYGHFFQKPPFERAFAFLWFDRNQADVNMGNPNIDPQKTITYEVGISSMLSQNLALDITLYQKNMFHLEGYRIRKATAVDWFFQAFNEEYAESRGVEIVLRKRMNRYFGGYFAYTYSIAKGTSSDVTQIHRYPLTSITYAKQLGYEPLYPQDTMPMNFDQRHVFNIVADFHVPDRSGPKLFNTWILSNSGANLTGKIHSGTPYTPITSIFVEVTTDRFNSARYPWTYFVDGRIFKDFHLMGRKLSVFLEVYNIFNWQNAISVFEGSGDPDKPLYQLTRGALSPSVYKKGESPMYSEKADFNNDGSLTTDERLRAFKLFEQDMLSMLPNYQFPRTFMFGVELSF